MDADAIPLPDLDDSAQVKEVLSTTFRERQERNEARVLFEWLRTNDLQRLTSLGSVPKFKRGPNPPDFLIFANGNIIAVEVSTFVTRRKAIYEKSRSGSGAYTSTLREDKPDAAFHLALKEHKLPDDSMVRPHFEATADLDHDYYEITEGILGEKINAAKHYSSLYNHTVVLIEDSLSELETVLNRRLPRLRRFVQSMQTPACVDVVVINTGSGRAGIAHRL